MIPIVVKGHERPLSQLVYNHDGDLLFSTSRDKRVCIWYSDSGELFATTADHKGAILSLDVDRKTKYFVTSAADFTIQFFSVKTGNRVPVDYTSEEGDNKEVFAVDFSATPRFVQFLPHENQNKLLVVRSKQMKSESAVFLYDVDLTKDDKIVLKHSKTFLAPQSPFVKAAFTYDGTRIITIHEDGSVARLNLETEEFECTVKLHTEACTDVQMSKDLSYFITASRDTNSYLVPVDGDLNTFKVKYQGDVGLNSAAISPINEIVIAGGGIRSIEVTTSSAGGFETHFFHKLLADDLGRVGGHFGPINTLAIHPFGTSFASGSEDGYIRIHHFDKNYLEFSLGK